MSVREYIGARYIPLFAEPLTWDATRTYEPLTVVLYQGNSYTSRQAVPANIDISNTTYWAQTGNYNAQIEQYRAEVQTFDGRITQAEDDVEAIGEVLPSEDFSSTNTVKKYIDDSVGDIEDVIPAANFTSTNTVKKYIDDGLNNVVAKFKQGTYAIIIGNSWVAPSGQLDPGYGDVLTSWMNTLCGASIKCFGRGSAGWLTSGQQSGQTIAAAVDEAIAYAATDDRVCTDVFFLEMQNDQAYFTQQNPSNYVGIVRTNINKIKVAIPNAKIHYIVDNAFSTTAVQYDYFVKTMRQALACEPIYTLPFFGEGAWRDTAHLADSLAGYGKLAQIIYTEMIGGEQVYPLLELSFDSFGGTYFNSENSRVTAKGDPLRGGIPILAQFSLKTSAISQMSGYQIASNSNTARFNQSLYLRMAGTGRAFSPIAGYNLSGKGAFQTALNWDTRLLLDLTPDLKTWLANPGGGVTVQSTFTTQGWD